MANHTSALLGGYRIFTSPAEPRQSSLSDSSHKFLRPRRLDVYVALGCTLLVAYLFQSYRDAKRKAVAVPFYRASLLKWMFNAESLVMDSYNKVSLEYFSRMCPATAKHKGSRPWQFYGKVYQIKATEGVRVMIPPNLLGEIKGLPEETLSSTAAVAEVGFLAFL